MSHTEKHTLPEARPKNFRKNIDFSPSPCYHDNINFFFVKNALF